MSYIAHIRESDGLIQTVQEHLLEVKALAESYGETLGVMHITGLAGLLHDLGKYSEQFRDYILEAVKNSDSAPKRGSVDHSTAGGKLLFQLLHLDYSDPYKVLLAEIVGNAIISHHGYLNDFLNPDLESNYLSRVRDKDLPEFKSTLKLFFDDVMDEQEFHQYVLKAVKELEEYLSLERLEEDSMFLTKFIFSSLIDADRTNTRKFEENGEADEKIVRFKLFDTYYDHLLDKIQSFKADTPINRLRMQMSNQCDNFAENPSGIYTLSIPTGGGKTLASFRYALKHAKLYSKKRIFYVIPYTTIIEQNAEEIRNIIKDPSNLLEHHSNVIEETNDNEHDQSGIGKKLKLAKDNWDHPVVFTTMVQFLNVFYTKGSRNIRRLHNLSDSIIIFDEVQKVPISCVSLFNQALNFLKNRANASIVLCTATQPALDFVENKLEINTDKEMISNLDLVNESFKRVQIIDKATTQTVNNEQLAGFIEERLNEVNNVLIILNTKTVVKKLYKLLKERMEDIPVFHLSTSMCAAHRNEILAEVKRHLQEGEKVICVSSQLIEAGVDISFECVIRSLAGLDSIAQAAGRCNRHGEKELQNVYIIDHSEETLSYLKEIQKGKEATKKILIDLTRDPNVYEGGILSQKAMDKYFMEYYTEFTQDIDYSIPKLKKTMTELLIGPRDQNSYRQAYYFKNNRKEIPLLLLNSYKTAAEHFHVINELSTSVIVPYGGGKEIIAELNGEATIEELSKWLRKAQQYSINLFDYEKRKLSENQGLVTLLDGKILALKEGAYTLEYGVDLENDSGMECSFI